MSDSTSVSSDSYSIVTTSTRTYVSGTSGFDTSALVEAAVQAKLAPAYTLEADIEEAELELAAYEELESLLATMQDALNVLRNEPGTTGEDSVFEAREAYLSSSDGTTATDYMGLTIEAGTDEGTYAIEILQVATAHKVGSATQTAEDAALSLSGSFTLGTDAGGSAEVAVTEDMTLQDIKAAINAVSDDSGVTASILEVSDASFMLVLTSVETGETITYAATDGTDIGQSLGLTAADGAFGNELQAAQNAVVTIDGVTIERSSNTIEDALEGVTLEVYAASEATFTVEIASDYSEVKEALIALVDAYNAYRDFVLTQQQVDSSGTVGEGAYLFGDSTLRSIVNAVYDALGTTVDVDGETFSLASLGLSFDSENYLTYDEDDLDEALLENIDAVAALLEMQFTSTDADLQILAHDTALASGSYQVEVTVDGDGAITGVSWDGDDSLFEIDGSRLIGKPGTAVAGLSLVYTGGASTSATVTLSQGLADVLYDRIDGLTGTDGALTTAMETLEDEIDDKTDRISDIEASATDYEERLIDYYATLEAKVATYEALLTYLQQLTSDSD